MELLSSNGSVLTFYFLFGAPQSISYMVPFPQGVSDNNLITRCKKLP